MKKFIKFYNALEEHLLAYSLAFTTLLIFVQVVMRYVFNSSLYWSEELARYIFIWQIWMGTSIAMKDKEHITLDMLPGKLKGNGKRILAIIVDLIMLAFCAFIVINGTELILSMRSRGNLSVALRIPMWIVYLSLPFSQFVVVLRTGGDIVKQIKLMLGKEVEPKEKAEEIEEKGDNE